MNLNVHIDGGARGNPGPAAAAVVIHEQGGSGRPLHEAAYFLGNASNNVAEYSALVRALELAVTLKPQEVYLHSDSELMVRQITGQYRVRSGDLLPLFERAQALLLKLDTWQIKHIYREANRRADELVNLALDAGRDVIIKAAVAGEAGQGAITPPPPAAATPGDAEKPGAKDQLSWRVTLDTDPRGACPAGCRQGQRFAFGATVPAGLCIHAAQAVLREVSMEEEPSADQPRQATCEHCNVKLRLEY